MAQMRQNIEITHFHPKYKLIQKL